MKRVKIKLNFVMIKKKKKYKNCLLILISTNFYFDTISSYIFDRLLSFLRAHISLDVVSGPERYYFWPRSHYVATPIPLAAATSSDLSSVFTMHSKNFTNREHVSCTLNGKQIRTGPRVSIQNISPPSTKN